MLSVAQVAVRCGVAEKTVRSAIRRGELVAARIGGRYRITREHFDQWIENCRAIFDDDDPPSACAPVAPVGIGSALALRTIERRLLTMTPVPG